MTLAYISHSDCLRHDMGPHHPECPARLRAIEDRLAAAGVMDWLRHIEAPEVSPLVLRHAHDALYLAELNATSPGEGYAHVDPDTFMNAYTLRAARRAAGAVVRAVDGIMAGEFDRAFCAVRPPGHHAIRNEAMGFCFYNNAAIGVLHALEEHGLARVALVDFDVHHGNGTQDIYERDGRVGYFSSHQSPLYPGTGRHEEHGVGNIHNAELLAGSGSVEFRHAWREQLLPKLRAFAPELLLISAGFDAHYLDPLAGLAVTTADYHWLTTELLDATARSSGGRVISMLEGGYSPTALAESSVAHVEALLDD